MQEKLLDSWSYLAPLLRRRLTITALLFWAPIVVFSVIAHEIGEDEPIGADIATLHFFHSISTPWLDQLAIFITNLASPSFIILFTLALTLVFVHFRKNFEAGIVFFAAGGAGAVTLLLKAIFQRDRPDLWVSLVTERDYSFPSGHSMVSSALALGLVVILWDTRWRWLAVVAGTCYFIAIGLTRIYLGVHYPTDVIGGWCIGLAWAILVAKLFRLHHAAR